MPVIRQAGYSAPNGQQPPSQLAQHIPQHAQQPCKVLLLMLLVWEQPMFQQGRCSKQSLCTSCNEWYNLAGQGLNPEPSPNP